MTMSPLKMTIVLHYYFRSDDIDLVSDRAVRELVDMNGPLLEANPPNCAQRFALTERGKAYVEMLKQVPMPVKSVRWVPPGME
jgi:hypothetical protein